MLRPVPHPRPAPERPAPERPAVGHREAARPSGGRPVGTPSPFWSILAGVALYLVIRAVLLIRLADRAESNGLPLLRVLTKADGEHYLRIAREGYLPRALWPAPGELHATLPDQVFFPGYPILIRAVARLLAPWNPSTESVALGVSMLAGTLAAAAIASWAHRRAGRGAAVALVGLWALWPSSVVLSMAYSESLLVLAAAVALWAIDRQRWLTAALAAAAAGAIRPVGAGVVAALTVALAGYLAGRPWWVLPGVRPSRAARDARGARGARGGRHGAREPNRWRVAVSVPAAATLSVVGLGLSLGHIARDTGRWDGWLWLQSTWWNSGSDGGRTSWRAVTLSSGLNNDLGLVVAGSIVVAVAGALWSLLRHRLVGWPALAYVAVCLVLGLSGHNYVLSKPRFLLVAFPLLLPAAAALAATWRLALLDGRHLLLRWLLRGPVRISLLAAALLVAVASIDWQVGLVVQMKRSI